MTHPVSKICQSVNRRIVFLAMLSVVVFLASNQSAFAGDQEGISGYKFKIYDPDGDGIDGNEVNAGSGGGAPSGTAIQPAHDGSRRDINLVIIGYQFRVWLMAWFGDRGF